MKIIVFFIFYILVCENVFSQTKIYSWEEIKNCTISYDRMKETIHSEKKRLSKQLYCHIRMFKKQWWKYHILINKDAKRKILKNLDCFYVPRYKIVEKIGNSIVLQLSNECVGFIIFVSDSNYLGCYNPCNCEKMRVNKNKCSPIDKLNYIVAVNRYSKADIAFAIDFFGKGRLVFSLENYEDENNIWFSSDGIKPIKFDSDVIIRKIISYDNESVYKSKFYEHASD